MPGSETHGLSLSANARITLGLLVAIALPTLTGFYWLGQLSEIVKGQGALIMRLDARTDGLEQAFRRQEERDRRQDEEMAKFRLEITRELGQQTALLGRQEEVMKAIRELLAKAAPAANGGGR